MKETGTLHNFDIQSDHQAGPQIGYFVQEENSAKQVVIGIPNRVIYARSSFYSQNTIF